MQPINCKPLSIETSQAMLPNSFQKTNNANYPKIVEFFTNLQIFSKNMADIYRMCEVFAIIWQLFEISFLNCEYFADINTINVQLHTFWSF